MWATRHGRRGAGCWDVQMQSGGRGGAWMCVHVVACMLHGWWGRGGPCATVVDGLLTLPLGDTG